jgi:Na+/H+ antiporter NhaA
MIDDEVDYSMPIPCKLPILKNISYLSGIMFTFSIFIPLISETSPEIDTNSLTILSITGMIISFGMGMKIRKKIAKKSKRLY